MIVTFGTATKEVESYLGVGAITAGDADNNRIISIINAVESFLKQGTRRKFEETTYTNEVHDVMEGQKMLGLSDYPVTVLTSVQKVSSIATDGTITWETLNGNEYVLDSDTGILFSRSRTGFPAGRQYMRVTYTAGYTSADITNDAQDEIKTWKLLELSLIAKEYGLAKENQRHLGNISFAEGSVSIQFELDALQRRLLGQLTRPLHVTR